MNIQDWLKSKKFKTAIVATIVPFVAYYLQIPMEVAAASVLGLISAILGFAHQDYAKAKDSLSNVQVDVLGTAIMSKMSESGKIDPDVAKRIFEVLKQMGGSGALPIPSYGEEKANGE